MFLVTILICAHNEEKNISHILAQLIKQKSSCARIEEIIIVSSASTDNTDKIIREHAKKDNRILLLSESTRKGKVSAVNFGLKNAKGDILVLCSADVQLEKNTLTELIKPFNDKKIGMVGSHPIPTNNPKKFAGFCSHLIWNIHHEISLKSPKCGEVVAFRNLGYAIPEDIPIDEAYLESKFKTEGYDLAYAEKAIIHNHGPETVADYLRQRRRIHAQHMFLKSRFNYAVSTSNPLIVLSALFKTMKFDPISLLFTCGAVKLEFFSIILGAYDFYIKKNFHNKWEMVKTTKAV